MPDCSADSSADCPFFGSLTAIFSRRFTYRIPQWMAADCSFFLLSTAFTTVFAPYFSADGGGLLILSLVNGFHDSLRAKLRSGLQRIAHTSARQRLPQRLARRIAQRMAADCSSFRTSKAFTTDCAPYCSSSGLLKLPLVNVFHDGLRAVLLSGWQRIAHSSTRQRFSRWFTRRIAPRMESGLLILPLVNGFHDGLRAVLPRGWQRIAHSSTRQRLSRWFARRIAPRMAADCSFLHSSTFTTVCAPYCSSDRSLDRLFFRSYAALPTVCMP